MTQGNRTANLNKFYSVEKFTPVEAKIVDMMKDGKTYKEITEELGMKINSLRRRITTINEKKLILNGE